MNEHGMMTNSCIGVQCHQI